MASVNKVILVGNLGRDPETRYAPEGGAITNISIATTDTWKDKTSGEKQERTEWHNIVVWGKQGENCGQYLSKGRQVYVEGAIRSHSYDDKDGNKRYMTEIIAQQVRFLGGGAGQGQGQGRGSGTGAPPPMPEEMPGGPSSTDDDIPF